MVPKLCGVVRSKNLEKDIVGLEIILEQKVKQEKVNIWPKSTRINRH